MAKLWLAIQPCFSLTIGDPSRLVHPRLENEREKQAAYRLERSISGKKGAEAHWNKDKSKHDSAIAKPIAEPMAKNSSLSSSSSSKKKYEYTPEFEAFFIDWPNMNGRDNPKQPAFKSWQKMTPQEHAIAKEVLPKHKQLPGWKEKNGQFIRATSTWLNQRGWEDKVDLQAANKPHFEP
jgi:hypothetical protein